MKDMAESAVELARKVFPRMADDVRSLLWEQLGNPAPVEASSEDEVPALPTGEETKLCPDCAETVKAAARKCRFCGYEFELSLAEYQPDAP
jgi:hypothetical protein